MATERDGRRDERTAERIRRFATEHIRDVAFPPGVIIAVSRVALASGGTQAVISVLVYPPEQAQAVCTQLRKEAPALDRRLFTALRMRHAPRVAFALDAQEMHRRRIEGILEEQKNSGQS